MGMTFDGENKVITLTTGTVAVSVRDLWSRWVDWFLTGDNSKYLPAFEQVGGNPIDEVAGTYIPIYAFLMNGWKIKPQEANHTLAVSDGILLVNGGGDPFNNTNGSYVVRINYQQPVQAISYSTEGAAPPTPESIADAVLAELIADHKAVSGSLAQAINEIRQRHAGAKLVADRDANTVEVYDADGLTLLFTLTRETVGNVDTYTRS
jgi:hypothetical protein